MPVLDTGFFLLMSAIAMAFMFMAIGFRNSSAGGVFNIISLIVFFTLALYLVSDYQVGTDTTVFISTINSTTGLEMTNSTETTTEYLINDFNSQTMVGLVYLVLGLFNSGLAFFAFDTLFVCLNYSFC